MKCTHPGGVPLAEASSSRWGRAHAEPHLAKQHTVQLSCFTDPESLIDPQSLMV